jgi:hypothetical protein
MYQPPQPPGGPGWGPPGYPPQGYPPQGYGAPPPPPKGTSKALIAIGAIAGICVLCGVAGALGKKDGAGGGSAGGGGSSSAASRQYVTQTCSEVAHMFGNRSQMTDLQQEELWRQYDGKWVRWTVRVGEISQSFGGLSMQFKCGTESLLFDGHARFDDAQRSRLLQITPNSTVQIEGRLDDHGRLLGLSLQDTTIVGQ